MKPEQPSRSHTRQTLPSGREVERYAIEGREQWLGLRQQDVTASAAGALLGGHPYITPYALWALKSGRITEDKIETPPMRRGRLLEPVAIELLREERPDWIVTRGAHYYRDPAKRLGCTPDAFARSTDTTDERFGIVQVKSVEPSVFRNSWKGEEGVEPPLWIALQAMVEATLTGAAWAVIAALTVSHGIELHLVEVDLTHQAQIIARLEDAVADFFRMVAAGTLPDVDYGRDLELIEELYKPTGATIPLQHDNEVLPLLDERRTLGHDIGAAQKRLAVIRGNLLTKLGTASRGMLPDGRLLEAKLIKTKAYTVEASSYFKITPRKLRSNEDAS